MILVIAGDAGDEDDGVMTVTATIMLFSGERHDFVMSEWWQCKPISRPIHY